MDIPIRFSYEMDGRGFRYNECQYNESGMDLNTEEASSTEEWDEEMEDTNLTEEEMQDCTQYRGKPYKDLTLDDLKGVEFKSIEEVDKFYSYYSLAKGFNMRKNKLDKNRAGTVVIRRQLVCSKEGKRRVSAPNDNISQLQGSKGTHFGRPAGMDVMADNCHHSSIGKNAQQKSMGEKNISGQNPHKKQCIKNRRITRGNCPASFTVKLCTKKGVYYTSEFITEHNHPLSKPERRQFLSSDWTVRDPDLAQGSSLRKVSMPACHAYEFLVHQAGGYKYVGFTSRNLYNKLQGERREVFMDGDAQSSVTWMNLKAMRDPHFYCIFSVNENGRLANMFWRDGQSLTDYNAFGDVLIFNNTWKSKIYGKALVLFVGCNNHRSTVLFGCALLVDETEETYNWVVTYFLKSMHGKKPTSVITNGDDAMRNAVIKLIPEARHRICAWHIGQNVCQHLKGVETQRDFFHFIFAGLTVEEWEAGWQYFVEMNRLENNKWVTDMYNKRDRWAEAFFRDHFFGGICSTQRCEGMHRNLKEGIGGSKRLYEVLPRMEKTIERIRNCVLVDDYGSDNSEPVYGSHMSCLQEEIGKRFTHDIFLLIKDQINFESKFVISGRDVVPQTCASLISLTQYGKPERRWTVLYQPAGSNPTFVCSCKLFQSDGIPCCHIFAVIKCEQLTTFPESLVNKRWTKEGTIKRTLSSSSLVNDKYVQIARYGELMSQCSKVCHLVSYSDEGYDQIREALGQLTIVSQKYRGTHPDHCIPEGEFQDGVLTQSQPMNLIHHREEVRPFEFVAGYEKSKNGSSNSNSDIPNFFQHFSPFPDL